MFSQVYEPKGYEFTYVAPEEMSSNLAAHLDEQTRLVWIEIADEPAAEHRRHPRRRGGGARRRRARRRRQHVRDAVPPAAARARRRHRRPLADEVPRRPLRPHRRLRGDERPDDRRAPALPPEVARRRPRPVRLLARAARPQDARRAHGAPLRERAHRGRVPRRRTTPSRQVLYPGLARPPGPRDRGAPDARLRRHGLVPHRDGGGGRRGLSAAPKIWKLAESLGGVESLIEHPARMTHASTQEGADRRAHEPRPPVGRPRVGLRSRRRPRAGARPVARRSGRLARP